MPYLNWDSPSKWFRRKWHQNINMDQFQMYFYWTWPGFLHFSSLACTSFFFACCFGTPEPQEKGYGKVFISVGIKLAENLQWKSSSTESRCWNFNTFFGIFTPKIGVSSWPNLTDSHKFFRWVETQPSTSYGSLFSSHKSHKSLRKP